MENKKSRLSFREWFTYWFNVTWRMRSKRLAIKWENFKKKSFNGTKPEIDNTQKKSIELFLALLKNKEASLNYSPESSTRIIESNFVWMTMTGQTDKYLFNIIDEIGNLNSHSHEVHIPKEYGFDIADEFDLELEKRFRALEVTKKRLIIDDLDKLIIKVQAPKK